MYKNKHLILKNKDIQDEIVIKTNKIINLIESGKIKFADINKIYTLQQRLEIENKLPYLKKELKVNDKKQDKQNDIKKSRNNEIER